MHHHLYYLQFTDHHYVQSNFKVNYYITLGGKISSIKYLPNTIRHNTSNFSASVFDKYRTDDGIEDGEENRKHSEKR